MVDEYDLDGNYIATYNTLIDAARSVNSNFNTTIHKCCCGINKFAFQRIWRFHGDPFDKYELPDKNTAERIYKLAPVDQYSLNGDFIRSYKSIAEANASLGLCRTNSHITECCKRKLCSAYGYVWRYQNDPYEEIQDRRNVTIYKYDKDHVFLKKYNSLKEACLDIKNKYSDTIAGNIRRCCKGERKSAYGFMWEYC